MDEKHSREQQSSKVIVVTSGKGGVGKTTTTANVGTGLAKLGKKIGRASCRERVCLYV